MTDKTFDPKLPMGFNYSVKNDEMSIHFYCDCCSTEIKVSQRIEDNNGASKKPYCDIFESLKKELDGQFYRCDECNFLICQTCWENKESKCKNCPLCVLKK
jgi:hypothetical protein